MLLQRKAIALILAGICLILLGMYSKNIFVYAPTIGWFGGILCMSLATFSYYVLPLRILNNRKWSIDDDATI